MTIKCPNCGGAITYDPASADFMCDICGSIFLAKDMIPPSDSSKKTSGTVGKPSSDHTNGSQKEQRDEDIPEFSEDTEIETMDYNVYLCTSCGAELLINEAETATFCAYCGQPTIVFDRISKHRKPKYIMPFSVSKNQAVSIIKNYLKKGDFIPDEFKKFNPDVIRGIYVPFWLYDIYYHDCQYFEGVVKSGDNTQYYTFLRDAKLNFKHITMDASKKLDNFSSRRLEPYNMSYLQPFDPHYLSGFYADCSDEDMTTLDMLATSRATGMFNRKIKETISAQNLVIKNTAPVCKITNKEYALLPVWFMVLRHDGLPYTIMVNGQSGKLVGGMPISKEKVKVKIAYWTIIFSILIFLAFNIVLAVFGMDSEILYELLMYVIPLLVMACGVLYGETAKNWKAYNISKQLSSEVGMDDYVSDRQGDLK